MNEQQMLLIQAMLERKSKPPAVVNGAPVAQDPNLIRIKKPVSTIGVRGRTEEE